ncbi:hypothetical protein SAZ11_38085 [Streptomyces sp. FXJ1.4098]|nr:hypothetical protein [Streptomyces sp. FXJ1.4098]
MNQTAGPESWASPVRVMPATRKRWSPSAAVSVTLPPTRTCAARAAAGSSTASPFRGAAPEASATPVKGAEPQPWAVQEAPPPWTGKLQSGAAAATPCVRAAVATSEASSRTRSGAGSDSSRSPTRCSAATTTGALA